MGRVIFGKIFTNDIREYLSFVRDVGGLERRVKTGGVRYMRKSAFDALRERGKNNRKYEKMFTKGVIDLDLLKEFEVSFENGYSGEYLVSGVKERVVIYGGASYYNRYIKSGGRLLHKDYCEVLLELASGGCVLCGGGGFMLYRFMDDERVLCKGCGDCMERFGGWGGFVSVMGRSGLFGGIMNTENSSGCFTGGES